jgi:hypothetical protein
LKRAYYNQLVAAAAGIEHLVGQLIAARLRIARKHTQ